MSLEERRVSTPMTASAPATPEVLRAPPRPWLRRLWVRVSLVLLLIGAISVATWWWPRRTMVAVWWVGGHVYTDLDDGRANAITTWFGPAGVGWLQNDPDSLFLALAYAREDRDITRVLLEDSKVGDEWLQSLRRCPQLTHLVLHDRQLGPGLDSLHDCQTLKHLIVQSASNGHLIELRRLRQLEVVVLREPQSGDLGLDALAALPQLKKLFVHGCRSTSEVLASMPELPKLEWLHIRECTGFVEDDLRHLQRLRNLKLITICSQTPLGDAALNHLSQLNHLESLCLDSPCQSFTQHGMRALSRMKSLKELFVFGVQWTPEQLKLLRDQLPNCAISVN